jgi:hypothetical protein
MKVNSDFIDTIKNGKFVHDMEYKCHYDYKLLQH